MIELDIVNHNSKNYLRFTWLQTTVPTPDDVVAVSNLLDQMTSLLEMEQTMLDDLLMQEDGSVTGQERLQMGPLQEV